MLNRAMKLFWKILLKKTGRIYEELKTSNTEVVQAFQQSVFWEQLLKKTIRNTIVAKHALYRSDISLQCSPILESVN
jgi:hypothetical protein